jgi:S-adenosylmethionine synthetase
MDLTRLSGITHVSMEHIKELAYIDISLARTFGRARLQRSKTPMANTFVFSSESVGEGHPDKVADLISDSILDACLAFDKTARVACETFVKSNVVVVGGEITLPKLQDKKTGKTLPISEAFNVDKVIRDAIRHIGYVHDDDVFHADTVFINNYLTAQSADIAQGVDAKKAEGKKTAEQGAGDQGLMFGFASDETEELMPSPIIFAHRLGRELTAIRKAGKVKWLRPDAKTQVSVRYVDGVPTEIVNVVISTQHTADVAHAEIEAFLIKNVIKKVLPAALLNAKTEFLINPTGKFVIGGPQGDSGLTGRKIIVDTYGGWGRHGGGAFSGKDPSKVDRSAAYMGRWVAKNIVAAKLAKQCEVQFAYAIGHPKPVSVYVNTFGTGAVADELITEAIQKVFSFKPADIVKQLDLLQPFYRQTTNYGHFGKTGLPWETATKVADLQAAVKKLSK